MLGILQIWAPSVKNAALTLSGMTSHPDVNLNGSAMPPTPWNIEKSSFERPTKPENWLPNHNMGTKERCTQNAV